LEVFLPEAHEHWASKKNALLRSGAFTVAEGSDREDELLLQATATCLGDRRMLYIGPYTTTTDEHREIMQKTRELMLAHEALQRKEAELRESEARMGRILKVLPDQVFLVNTTGEVITHAGGPDNADLTGLVIDALLPEIESIRDTLEMCIEKKRLQTLEFGRRLGSVTHFFEARIAPMGEDLIVIVVRDCTRAKTIESVKEEFLSIACHELRSPVSGIIGVLEMAQEEGLSEASESWVQMGLNSARSSIDLMNRLLDLTRIESGAQEFNRRRVTADSLIQDGVNHCQGVAIKLKRSIEQGICDKDLMVLADPDAIRQVMVNLATNALKFSPVEHPVILDVKAHDGFARISVRDKGPGIREKDRLRIFEKFAQIQSVHHREKGTGLGLSIARAIVQGHRGRIGVDSDPEVEPGATFWFDLPLI
jgi:signal transduction histidine kinase